MSTLTLTQLDFDTIFVVWPLFDREMTPQWPQLDFTNTIQFSKNGDFLCSAFLKVFLARFRLPVQFSEIKILERRWCMFSQVPKTSLSITHNQKNDSRFWSNISAPQNFWFWLNTRVYSRIQIDKIYRTRISVLFFVKFKKKFEKFFEKFFEKWWFLTKKPFWPIFEQFLNRNLESWIYMFFFSIFMTFRFSTFSVFPRQPIG